MGALPSLACTNKMSSAIALGGEEQNYIFINGAERPSDNTGSRT
jgi:hypothetical protein